MSLRLKLLVVLAMFIPFANAETYGKRICNYPGYHCQKVKNNQTWISLFPDEHDRSIAMRVNRMNTQLYAGLTLAVPDNIASTTIMDFSPFPLRVQPIGEKVLIVDPLSLAWGAYDPEGMLLRWGPASSGADYCKDIDQNCQTTEGEYRIYSLGSSNCFSTKFPVPDGGAPMPYCMYFNNGQALHGEPNGLPGYNASHGCVRLYVNDAEWLRYTFIEGPNPLNSFRGTKIMVKEYPA